MPEETIPGVERKLVGKVVQSFIDREVPQKKQIKEIRVVKKDKGKWDVTATFYG